jgi:uncharacterized membrane protein
VLDWTSGKILEVTALVRTASVLAAILMVSVAYYKVRSIVALIVAAITAGVFLFTINNVDWWTERVEEESDTLGRTVHVTSERAGTTEADLGLAVGLRPATAFTN